MSTQTEFEKLVYTLDLSPFQAREIYLNRDSYDMSRIEKRGPVLFVPHRASLISRIVHGRRGDVIGRDRMFLAGAQRVKMCAGGYHTGCVGASTYYGTPDGRAIMRDAFDSAVRGK